MTYLLSRTAALAALVLLATACSKEDATPATDTSNNNMLLGNPSGAVSDPAKPMNYLLARLQYAVGYHRD